MPTWALRWSAGSRTERQQYGLQRVPTKFGQFLREQRDLQHNFDLCHAQALTLVQSTNHNMQLVFKYFC